MQTDYRLMGPYPTSKAIDLKIPTVAKTTFGWLPDQDDDEKEDTYSNTQEYASVLGSEKGEKK